MMDLTKRTKIVCTIGPASAKKETLTAMVQAGMNVCRLNFSHGTHEQHASFIKMIREVGEETGEPLAILQDLQGPKIRVGELPPEGVSLEEGKEIILTTGTPSIPQKLPVTYPKLHEDVKSGERILLNDGLFELKVTKVDGQDVHCEIIHGGNLTSHKGINLPMTETSISALSDKDREDVKFGVEQNVDWIALSFVRSAADLNALRSLLDQAPILLIAKIEKPEAVEHFDEILAEADGIMVARGDLGVEMPAEKVPIIQKQIIAKCLAAAKPVIVATQMLESMIHNPRATRAEISDVANAVIDHADATMLSAESASGEHPVEAVQAMAATIREMEASAYDDMPPDLKPSEDSQMAMTNIASLLASDHQAKAIVVASMSGHAGRLVSSHRPELPIFVATPRQQVVHQLNLSWGVRPFYLAACATIHELMTQAQNALVQGSLIKTGDEIVMVAGEPLGRSGNINFVELMKV